LDCYGLQLFGAISGKRITTQDYWKRMNEINEKDDESVYLAMLFNFGILKKEEVYTGRGMEYLEAVREGKEILYDIEDKIQNYCYFESIDDPNVNEEMSTYKLIKGCMILQFWLERKESFINDMKLMANSIQESDEQIEMVNSYEQIEINYLKCEAAKFWPMTKRFKKRKFIYEILQCMESSFQEKGAEH
jgi:hypothetical protein